MRVVISECCLTSSKNGKRSWYSKHLENNTIRNAQCVHTIALVCSPKIGNDRQPLKPLSKLTKISYPVKIWGAIKYHGSYNL